MDIGQNTIVGNCDSSQELAQFLIISDDKLDVPQNDPILLVIPHHISSQLQNLKEPKYISDQRINQNYSFQE